MNVLKLEATPESQASWLSKSVYEWLTKLLLVGAKRPLELSDISELDPSYKAERIYAAFKKHYHSKSKPQFKVFYALYQAFGREFMKAGVYLLVQNLLTGTSPIFLLYLIKGNQPDWVAYLLSLGLLLMQLATTLFTNWHYEMAMRTGFKIKTALTMALYEKGFKLSSKAKQEHSIGKIVNVASTDTNRLDISMQFFHMMYGAPLLIVLVQGLLYWLLGISSLVGLLVMLLYFPVQQLLTNMLTKQRRLGNQSADQRIKYIQETMSGMRIIKIYCWEDSFFEIISQLRKMELKAVIRYLMVRAAISGVTQVVPLFAMILTFIVYSLLGNPLQPDLIFSSLALFYVLRVPLLIMPLAVSQTIDAWVAAERVGLILEAEENEHQIEFLTDEGPAIEIQGSFEWPKFQLEVDLSIPKGSLVAVIGSVGSGKSSLMSALVGEMPKKQGKVVFRGSMGYCQQQAWIQNATIKDNILFGLPFDKDRYTRAIELASMTRDISILPGGDMTEIGEKGINLSAGGQKQRLSIARAIYSDPDIILMDDPLSAVDAHVGRFLFDELILKHFKTKTRILVTHQLHFLPLVDYIVCLDNGKITHQGTYQQLIDQSIFKHMELSPPEEHEVQQVDTLKVEETKFNLKEERNVGAVERTTYHQYVTLAGSFVYLATFLLILNAQAWRVYTDQWLSIWTRDRYGLNQNTYIYVYIGLGIGQMIAILIFGWTNAWFGVKASQKIHDQALKELFSAPIAFFDSTPLGRITSRFSRDIDTLDNLLPESLRTFVFTSTFILSNFVLISINAYYFVIPLVPVLICLYYFQKFYRKTSRELKRLDSITRSPLLSIISETLTGVTTIVAYGSQPRFMDTCYRIVDENNKTYYPVLLIQRWMQLRLESINSVLVFFTCIFTVIQNIDAGTAGLLISYAMLVTSTFTWCIKQATDSEMNMNAAERMLHYIHGLPQESKQHTHQDKDLVSWPQRGKIEAQNLSMRYRPDLPLVLNNLSFLIQSGEKVGIVGRTGAGKSTILQSLLRLFEAEQGFLKIDDIDIKQVSLQKLRSSIAVIPQEPVLFLGTLRSNLDPFSAYTDEQLWQVVKKSGLKADNLEMTVTENGSNWSTGQRQLICLARAMLRDCKILLLDEATASVDLDTDAFIQEAIRKDFKSTIITIAHRLNTVADYDKIMVLDHGQIVEFDTPKQLLEKRGHFYAMVMETGEYNAQVIHNLAHQTVVEKQ
ncbi:P-loop containing nucleoside triphosphate hydrolase protein [Gorgonomyces haynaldii]|nr:P-loop containing nucleoside triphosphate hydrolase protein [Gorgonomyces haynaldii]